MRKWRFRCTVLTLLFFFFGGVLLGGFEAQAQALARVVCGGCWILDFGSRGRLMR